MDSPYRLPKSPGRGVLTYSNTPLALVSPAKKNVSQERELKPTPDILLPVSYAQRHLPRLSVNWQNHVSICRDKRKRSATKFFTPVPSKELYTNKRAKKSGHSTVAVVTNVKETPYSSKQKSPITKTKKVNRGEAKIPRKGPRLTRSLRHTDIIVGAQGHGVNQRRGNLKFRTMCWKARPAFLKTKGDARLKIAMQVARQVQDLNPPGRFLSIKGGGHTPRPGTYYQLLDRNQALEKIASTISNLKMEPTTFCAGKVQAKVPVKMEKVVALAVASVQKKTKSKNTGGRKPANCQETQKEKPRFSAGSTKLKGTKAAAQKMKAQEPSLAIPLLRLRKTDVILLEGRGAPSNTYHGGNVRLAEFCSNNTRAYKQASTRRDKQAIVSKIVKLVQNSTPPGRFVTPSSIIDQHTCSRSDEQMFVQATGRRVIQKIQSLISTMSKKK